MPGLTVLGFMLAVAGCQSGDTASVLQPKASDVAQAQPAGQQEMVLESDLRGYCPRVTLKADEAVLDVYANAGQKKAKRPRGAPAEEAPAVANDPRTLVYRASVSDATRDCRRSGGMLSITVALAGRVVPGPAGAPQTVTLPIKIVMLQGGDVLKSEVQPYPLALTSTSAATQFVYTGQPVTIPEPTSSNIQIFVGFDIKPSPKAAGSI